MSNSVAEKSISTENTEKRDDEVGKKRLFEIDFIGNESYVNSQRDVLLSRSEEHNFTDREAMLSARGLHHRSREHFAHDLKETTAVIRNMMKEDKGAKKSGKPSA